MLFPDTPPNKALGRSPARVFGTLAFALAVLFYFLPVHSSTDNPNNGLWIGKFDINGKGPYQFDVLYINGEAVGRSDDAKVICRGNVSFKNGYYSEMDMFYKAGSPMGSTAIMQGTVPEPGLIDAFYRTRGSGDRGEIKLRRHPASDKRALLKSVVGPWILYRGYSILQFNVSKRGVIRGGNTEGCAYDGRIKPVDSRYNAYRIKLVTTSCNNLDGTWEGLAYLSDDINADDTLNLYLFDDGESDEEDWAMMLPMARNKDTQLIDKHKQWNP